jgi:putative lipoic acid-binding regulatory protein
LNTKEEEFYSNLKEKLEEFTDWPNDYLFKFIIPSEEHKIEKLKSIFEETNAIITTRTSSKGKFTSVSVRLNLENPDQVIEKYKIVGIHIEGVISL